MGGARTCPLRAPGLGDFFTGLPALKLLREALPTHRIVLAAPRRFGLLARRAGTVGELVQAHELTPLSAPPRHPELAFDLHGNGPESRALLLDCAPDRLLAYENGGKVGWALSAWRTARRRAVWLHARHG